jgi:hypothetical protein
MVCIELPEVDVRTVHGPSVLLSASTVPTESHCPIRTTMTAELHDGLVLTKTNVCHAPFGFWVSHDYTTTITEKQFGLRNKNK